MLLSLVMYHAGLICAVFAFLVWSLPGAVGMFLLSIGVGKIKDVLPGPVYGLLSGLNASTVGIIALAAVQVSEYGLRVGFILRSWLFNIGLVLHKPMPDMLTKAI